MFKSKKLILILTTLMLVLNIQTISATDIGADYESIECETYEEELISQNIDTTALTCDQMKVMYLYPTSTDNEGVSKSLASGFLSSDLEKRELEKQEYYYKYFFESHLVPYAGEVDDTLLGIDSFSNMGVFVIGLMSDLLGLINMLFTTIIMFLVSIWLNDTLVGLVNGVITFINSDILGLDSEVGTGYILSALLGLLLILRLAIKYMKEGKSPTLIIKPFIMTLILVALIPFSYTTLRPILVDTTEVSTDYVYSKVYKEEDYELDLKDEVFSSVAFNGYMLKNFGVVSEEQLAIKDNITIEESQSRVEGLLQGSDSAIQKEYDHYNNDYLAVTLDKALAQFMITFLWLINAIMTSLIILIPILLLLLLSITATLSFGFMWIVIIRIIFKMEDNVISEFIYNRVQFFIAYLVINFALIIILKGILNLLEVVTGLNIGLLLIIDILFIVIYYLLWSVREQIFNLFKQMVKSIPSIVTGTTSLKQVSTELKSKALDIKKATIKKLSVKEIVTEEDKKTNQGVVVKEDVLVENTSDIVEKNVSENTEDVKEKANKSVSQESYTEVNEIKNEEKIEINETNIEDNGTNTIVNETNLEEKAEINETNIEEKANINEINIEKNTDINETDHVSEKNKYQFDDIEEMFKERTE